VIGHSGARVVALAVVPAASPPPGLAPAREQMALSLGWHIVLACFGVAFPAMIYVMHRRAIRRDDAVALELAKRWSKVAAVLFAVGAVSGTVLSFEMGLLWPGLMRRFGDVLGLPFAVEGIAFFVEAIFLGIYLHGWGRLAPRTHLRTLLPVAAAGVVGSYCVVAVNAWMNAPAGFTLAADGKVTNVQPLAAMFNKASYLQFAHMWVVAMSTTASASWFRSRSRRSLRCASRSSAISPACGWPRTSLRSWRRSNWRRPPSGAHRCASAASSSMGACVAR